jgi:ABC-2 type transport system permease protein
MSDISANPAPTRIAQLSMPKAPILGPGFNALFVKECLRFWKVAFQTIVAPVVTTLLYLLIFSHALSEHVKVYDGRVAYVAFLVPGLIMMSVLQNAFANSSSSLIQSKMMRNLIFILLPPITSLEIFCAYVFGAMVRGLSVGFGVWLVTLPFVPWVSLVPDKPLWVIAFAIGGSAVLGTLGLVAGIWSEKFDHLSVFQNFIIMPLTFLAGTFYSIQSLPAFWQSASHFNPFFYMIDGFRYGFFGVSDVSPWISLGVVAFFVVLLSAIAMKMLVSGYKLRQ